MDKPLGPNNWLCRTFGHWWKYYTDHTGIARRSCNLCPVTEPPFRKIAQTPPHDYLPDDQQPPGAR